MFARKSRKEFVVRSLLSAVMMLNHSRLTLLSIALLFVMLFSLACPMAAYADDGTPPPPATEEPVVSDQSPVGSVQPSGEEAVSDESADMEAYVDEGTPPAPATEEPVVSDQSVVDSVQLSGEETASDESANTAPTEVVLAEETVSIPEVLEQLPDDTAVVVTVDGEIEPLATQDAAEAIVSGDPVWCPATLAAPTPGLNGCTASVSSLQDLLNALSLAEPTEAGIIWIESSYDSSANDATSTGFEIDGGSFTTMSNHALTIQGGWSGISGDASIGSASLFNGDYLHITNWQGNVTINNIQILGASGGGLLVASAGDIALSNVTANGNGRDGASLNNTAGTGSITVDKSMFNDNTYTDSNGLAVYSNGNITFSNVTANGNGGSGAYLNNCNLSGTVGGECTGTGNISIDSSTFNNNDDEWYGNGLRAYSNDDITLFNVVANGNGREGALLTNDYEGASGGINISDSTFGDIENGNGEYGLQAYSSGDITLTDVTANDNGWIGVSLDNGRGTDDITVDQSTFNDNGSRGLSAVSYGSITLSQVTANGNEANGAYLFIIDGAGDDSITISDSTFGDIGYGNVWIGLEAYTSGDIALTNVTASGNYWDGTYLDNCISFYWVGCAGTGSISVNSSTFNGNGMGSVIGSHGMEAYSSGDITLTNVTANGNEWEGAYLNNFWGTGNINVSDSTFDNPKNSDGIGLDAYSSGDITLTNVTANGNTEGVYVETDGSVTIVCSQFNNNETYGVDAEYVTGIFTLNDVTFSGNGTGDYIGSPVITSGACPPPPSDGGNGDKGHGKNGQNVPLYIIIKRIQNQLPGELGAENTFVSALKVVLTGRGAHTPGLAIKLSFPIPQSMKDANLAVLFWNGSEWVDVPGGSVVDDYFVITVNKPGIYVLVSN
ncbi:MAG TPA: right-handed parallel beta-helix repeat-containing protein [Anaerolineales bacterium]|nr:right-handed parallel beta-helix repeat-containing protein [Anaerolineales bacterium]